MKSYTFAIAALLVAAPVFAQTPSDESVQKLLDLAQISQLEDNMFALMPQQVRQELEKTLPFPKQLTTEQKQQVMKLLDDVVAQNIALLNTPEQKAKRRAAYAGVYKRHFTQAEVDHNIAYYQHPLTQSVLKKQKAIIQDVMTVMNSEMFAGLEAEQRRINEEAMRKIPEIIGKKPAKSQPRLKRKAKP